MNYAEHNCTQVNVKLTVNFTFSKCFHCKLKMFKIITETLLIALLIN